MVASIAAITGLIFVLRDHVPVVSTGVLYLLAVLLVSSYWGRWLGLLTSVLSAAAFNWFHIPPTGRFSIAESENWLALGVYLVTAVVASSLAESARQRAEEAERERVAADRARDELEDLSREIILDHYQNPRNQGRLEHPTLANRGHNPLCGDEIELSLAL